MDGLRSSWGMADGCSAAPEPLRSRSSLVGSSLDPHNGGNPSRRPVRGLPDAPTRMEAGRAGSPTADAERLRHPVAPHDAPGAAGPLRRSIRDRDTVAPGAGPWLTGSAPGTVLPPIRNGSSSPSALGFVLSTSQARGGLFSTMAHNIPSVAMSAISTWKPSRCSPAWKKIMCHALSQRCATSA